MIRVAHFSDLHYGGKTLAEAERCFGAAIDQAIAREVAVAVVSGDATDHALDLHAPAATRLLAQIRRLAEHCPVLMLQGTFSHEPPGTLRGFALLGGRYPVQVVERIGQIALGRDGQWQVSAGWRFDTLPDGCRALFSCVPTVNKAAVAAVVGAPAAAEAVGEHLSTVLRGFAPSHRAAQQAGVATLGVAHGTVFGCVSEQGVPMAGFDHEFTSGSLFAAEAQAFLLGHIHRHQRWERTGPCGPQCIAYAGSIGRFHFGEVGDKGWVCWTLAPEQVQCELVPTPAQPTLDIVIDGVPDPVALRAHLAGQALQGTRVRVRWQVAEEDAARVDRAGLLQVLGEAAEVKFEGRVIPLVRTRAAGLAAVASLPDKIRVWASVTEAPVEPLLECLAQLAAATAEDIAQQVLHPGTVAGHRPGGGSCAPCP